MLGEYFDGFLRGSAQIKLQERIIQKISSRGGKKKFQRGGKTPRFRYHSVIWWKGGRASGFGRRLLERG